MTLSLMYVNIYKKTPCFIFPHAIIQFLFTSKLFFVFIIAFVNQYDFPLYISMILLYVSLYNFQPWFNWYNQSMTPNYWNKNYSLTFDNTWALGPYCETLYFHTFWISDWNFKHFRYTCILWFGMPLINFSIETRFTCANIFFNPNKINIKPTL